MTDERRIKALADNALEAFQLLKRVVDESDVELDENDAELDGVIIPTELSDEIDAFFERISIEAGE